jgi:hypothetical protein
MYAAADYGCGRGCGGRCNCSYSCGGPLQADGGCNSKGCAPHKEQTDTLLVFGFNNSEHASQPQEVAMYTIDEDIPCKVNTFMNFFLTPISARHHSGWAQIHYASSTSFAPRPVMPSTITSHTGGHLGAPNAHADRLMYKSGVPYTASNSFPDCGAYPSTSYQDPLQLALPDTQDRSKVWPETVGLLSFTDKSQETKGAAEMMKYGHGSIKNQPSSCVKLSPQGVSIYRSTDRQYAKSSMPMGLSGRTPQ